MNDTKTLCDVVGRALDEYGNGKAQDAFAELLTHLRDVEKVRDEDQGVIRVWRGRCERAEAEVAQLNEALAEEHSKAEGAYARGLAVHAEEARAAEADNAALLKYVAGRDCNEVFSGDDCIESNLSRKKMCLRCRIVSDPHPGAALLEDLEGMRKQVAFKDGKIDRIEEEAREHFAARQNALKVCDALRKELKLARDAALEEAIKTVHANVDKRNITAVQACGLLDDIRALKGTK